jgi:hypothetical protein
VLDADDEELILVLEIEAEEEAGVLEADLVLDADGEELILVLEAVEDDARVLEADDDDALVLDLDEEELTLVLDTEDDDTLVLDAEVEARVLETNDEDAFVLDIDELTRMLLDTTLEDLDIEAEDEELATTFFPYVLNDPIFQNWFLKISGFLATYFLQLSIGLSVWPVFSSFCNGQVDPGVVPNALPAHSPQKLLVKMKRWSLKRSSILQSP